MLDFVDFSIPPPIRSLRLPLVSAAVHMTSYKVGTGDRPLPLHTRMPKGNYRAHAADDTDLSICPSVERDEQHTPRGQLDTCLIPPAFLVGLHINN